MGVHSGAPSQLDAVAKNLVITWASSGIQDGEVSRAARGCFEGATAVRYILAAVHPVCPEVHAELQRCPCSLEPGFIPLEARGEQLPPSIPAHSQKFTPSMAGLTTLWESPLVPAVLIRL